MASDQKSDIYNWPSDPKNYQWKGTLSVHNGIWNVLAHCKPRKEDVFLKIKQTKANDNFDIEKFTENTKKLINIQHKNLLTPVHAFVHKSEIWVVYPRHSGGPLIEVLTSHYPNGIPDESIVSCILYDICSGLQNLHKQQQCHRNINASSLHIDIDDGCALLSEFRELKEIKWKHQTGQRNSLVSPEREPFTDPLILMGDESASWYAGDIYAFGITALQLTYGNTPPLSIKNILQQKSMNISTDLYDKKCPFSKAFENMIRDCCANKTENRIKINKLMEHKFFAKRAEHAQIKQYFGHILKSTEKRINSSLTPPDSFNPNGMIKKEETIDENKANVHGNGMKIALESNGIANSEKKDKNSEEWSFSTSLRKSDIDMKVLQQQLGNEGVMDTPVVSSVDTPGYLSPGHHPTMHNAQGNVATVANSYNDPTQQHEAVATLPISKPEKQPRNYHVSFSESESQSLNLVNQDSGDMNNTVQINRFKVEFTEPSRLSESGTLTQIEPSETNDEEHTEYDPHGDDSEEETPACDTDNQSQTIQIKRFHITPAKLEASADECDENNNNNASAQPQPQPQPQLQQTQPKTDKADKAESKENTETQTKTKIEKKYSQPSIEKTKWSKEEVSEWVGSFGTAFAPYIELFVANGINGAFMGEVTNDDLKEIVPSNMHRKRILTAWKKLTQQ